jgi:Diacylglycerol kinase catalytic domain
MKRTLLIINIKSGSANALGDEDLVRALKKADLCVEHIFHLPDDSLPDRSFVEKMGFEVVVTVSGDGTVASVCDQLSGWAGSILVLPGGTMNLLSKRLHGDQSILELLDQFAEHPLKSVSIPVIKAGTTEIFTGLIAGPSTQWGEVRESIRNLDLGELVEKVPEAWTATTTGDSVRIQGQDGGYPAIFVEPLDNGNLGVRAFKADGVGDMLGHGVAWLRRDFREGPHDDLGEMRTVTIIDDSDNRLGLLVDGEQEKAQSPLTCTASKSSVRFLRVPS